MSKTKNYVVTIYNGKVKQEVYIRAKSDNSAKEEGLKFCRDNKIVGGAVLSVRKN